MNIPRFLAEDNFWVFLGLTVVLGGGAAWLTGRAVASSWRTPLLVVAYALVLAAAVRFFHYALFRGTLTSLHYYLVDAVVCLTLGLIAYRVTRVGQMTAQYAWINTRNGAFGWRADANRPAEAAPQDR